jgi:hypothetical protein
MMRWITIGLAIALSLLCPAVQAAEPGRDAAETTLAEWIDGLAGKTVAELARELGPPREKTHWEFEGKPEILLKYTTAQHAELSLYFYKARVVKVSYQRMSR